MEFVRTIVDSKQLEKIIYMPKNLKNQKVEVLILPILDKQHKKKKEFAPEDFEGVLKIDVDTLDKEIEHMRDEWETIMKRKNKDFTDELAEMLAPERIARAKKEAEKKIHLAELKKAVRQVKA